MPKSIGLILFFTLFAFATAWSQTTFVVKGRVIDADTKEGLPFCNVFVDGTTLGVSSDVDGYFEITLKHWAPQLSASAIGYTTAHKPLSRESEQTIDFQLKSSEYTLSEVVVIAGENPANAIVRNIIKNKDKNSLQSNNTYQYESYAKVEVDLENIPDKVKQSKLMKPFEFVFENIDSTSDEKPFLPVYINELLQDVYYVQGEGQAKNVLRAQRTSGTDNETIIEFIKKIHAPFSIYDNWIYVLEKGFISPFANAGLSYYEYYIIDSTYINGQWSYKLKFKPKRKQETTFYGDFWVADTTFAVQRVNMRMSPDVNINLVRRIIIYQEFDYIEKRWLPVKQKMVVDFSPTENAPAMIGRRTESIRDYRLNQPDTRSYYRENDSEYYEQELLKRDEAFWQEARHEQLTKTEAAVYAMIDSIQKVPIYKTYVQVFETLFQGYFEWGNFEFGPYSMMYSYNLVEGNRFRLGARTNTGFNKNLRLSGSLAYGLKDERWKYSGEVLWLLSRRPRVAVGAAHRRDISLNSENSEEFLEGDLFSGFLRRDIIMKLIDVQETKLFYERYWKNGFSNRVTLLHRTMDPYGGITPEGGGFNYAYLNNPNAPERVDTTINATELIFKTRFALKEEFLEGDFERVSIGTEHPIIELQYTMGINGLFGGDYNFHKVSLYYRHYVNINPIGWLAYRFKAGKVFGTVPFLLMEVHPGNEAYFMTRGIFNTMNRYEFASDTYASLILEHHDDGFLFNKIPLLRKLKWRNVFTFKALIGSISEKNLAANRLNAYFPTDENTYNGFRAPSRYPYMEAGVGIENIFKFIRIDAVWRLNYLDNPQASRFSIIAGMYFYF